MSENILEVHDLTIEFQTEDAIVKAVEHVSFTVKAGQTLGIVGESGSGKSVSALSIMGLLPEKVALIRSGTIKFKEEEKVSLDLLKVNEKYMQSIRGNRIGMIFQEPMTSLNPVMRCGKQVAEVLIRHKKLSKTVAHKECIRLFEEVLLPRPKDIFDVYPHQLSGGQKQRVMIAMALACNPALLIADEPTTALDVTVQKSILDLIHQLQQKYGMAVIFITHDLGVVAQLAHEVVVMYKGQIVEQGLVKEIFMNPQHPYTKGLLACRPPLGKRPERLLSVSDFMDITSIKDEENHISTQEITSQVANSKDSDNITSKQSDGVISETNDNILKPKIFNKKDTIKEIISDLAHSKEKEDNTSNQENPKQSDAINENLEQNDTIKVIKQSDGFISVKVISLEERRLRHEILYKKEPILRVKNLKTWFPVTSGFMSRTKGYIKAVDDVSFDVYSGETLGLVGESGCGKTTLGRSILRLVEPTEGSVHFEDQDLIGLKHEELRRIRRHMQIIFQDPYSSLNPRMTIGTAITEPMLVHGLYKNDYSRRDKAMELLEKVQLKPEHFNRYPHEFSGGQRQRICIARALALEPGFIICDESVSALDVSVQAQILNLLNQLKKDLGFTYIFISHDLNVVKYMSDRLIVMKDGKIVEQGEADEVYSNPETAYTKGLIKAIPTIN